MIQTRQRLQCHRIAPAGAELVTFGRVVAALREARPRVRRHRGRGRSPPTRPTQPLWTSWVTFTPTATLGARRDANAALTLRRHRGARARVLAARQLPLRRRDRGGARHARPRRAGRAGRRARVRHAARRSGAKTSSRTASSTCASSAWSSPATRSKRASTSTATTRDDRGDEHDRGPNGGGRVSPRVTRRRPFPAQPSRTCCARTGSIHVVSSSCGRAGASAKPCAVSQPSADERARGCRPISAPSATTSSPNLCPSSMTVLTIVRSFAFVSMPRHEAAIDLELREREAAELRE